MARYKHIDTSPRLIAVDLQQQLLPGNIEAACREHIIFIALSGDTAPHCTTIAHFIGTLGDEITQIFSQVLYICDQQGLIGREMFAIDGVKLPGNAAKAKSGTRAEFIARAAKLEAEAKKMVARHREEDAKVEPAPETKATKRIERLTRDAKQMRDWLAANPAERKGAENAIIKSNLTDC